MVARTLLGDETMMRVARILNQTEAPCRLQEGEYFAMAEPPCSLIGARTPAVGFPRIKGDRVGPVENLKKTSGSGTLTKFGGKWNGQLSIVEKSLWRGRSQ